MLKYQPSASTKGKERDRSFGVQHSAQESVEVYHRNLRLLANESILQVDRAMEHDTQQEQRAKKSRKPGWQSNNLEEIARERKRH